MQRVLLTLRSKRMCGLSSPINPCLHLLSTATVAIQYSFFRNLFCHLRNIKLRLLTTLIGSRLNSSTLISRLVPSDPYN